MDWEEPNDMMPPVEEEEQMNNFFGAEETAPAAEENSENEMLGMMNEPPAELGGEMFDGEAEVELTQKEGAFMPMDNNMMPVDNTGGGFFGHDSSEQSSEVAKRFEEERKAKMEVIEKAKEFKDDFHEKRKGKTEERFKIQKDRELLKQEEETEGEGGNIWKKVYELVQVDAKKERKPKKEEKKKDGEAKKVEVAHKKKDISRYYQLIKNYSYES